MEILSLSNKHLLFQDHLPDWDLNVHVILGKQFHYLIDTGLGSGSMLPIKPYLYLEPKPIIVINTHHHWDHVWGNHTFDNTPIVSHTLCPELIQQRWNLMLDKNRQYVHGEVKMSLPNITFEDQLYFPNDKIRIFYTPGHTIDSISIFDEEEGILNAGDNIGDTIIEPVPSIEVDLDIYRNTLHLYQTLPVQKCISGHNQVLDADVFRKIEQLLSHKLST